MTYSGHLEELVGIRWTIISGASIMSLGVILTSISIQVRKRAIIITNEKKWTLFVSILHRGGF